MAEIANYPHALAVLREHLAAPVPLDRTDLERRLEEIDPAALADTVSALRRTGMLRRLEGPHQPHVVTQLALEAAALFDG